MTLADGSAARISGVYGEKLDEAVVVYNFEVEEFHTYYVTEAGVLVHNANKVGGCGVTGNKSDSKTVAKPNQAQGFSSKGYNPQLGERTVKGYVEQNANPEVALYTKSSGFNNSKGNAGGQFKRLGAEEHYGLSPHVHQPVRNVAPNGTIYGRTGKTVGVDTLSPSNKDVKQLYENLNNGKYH